jgi:uncharacterized protein YutE (UPF0331/DUF86 family)
MARWPLSIGCSPADVAEFEPRKTDLRRWRADIVRHLEEFPRQYAALESAMAAFGENFDLQRFKAAFNTTDDLQSYNQVQAVERAIGRVQNFVAELAISGVKLARLPGSSGEARGSPAVLAFESLHNAGVIDRGLCRRLVRAQGARTTIEHGYIQASAGDVHRAAELVRESARDFIGPYRAWIEALLEGAAPRGAPRPRAREN